MLRKHVKSCLDHILRVRISAQQLRLHDACAHHRAIQVSNISSALLIAAHCRRAAWARRHIVDMALRLRCSADFARVFADAGAPVTGPSPAGAPLHCLDVTYTNLPLAADPPHKKSHVS